MAIKWLLLLLCVCVGECEENGRHAAGVERPARKDGSYHSGHFLLLVYYHSDKHAVLYQICNDVSW